MNIKEYIASGILESYALGLTSAEESSEVERMVAEHPEVKDELEQVQLALESYATSYKKNPPPMLKQKVLDAIAEEENGKVKKKEIKKERPVISIDRDEEKKDVKRGSRFAVYLAAASILLLIAAGFYINNLREKIEDREHDLAQMSSDYDYLKKQMDEQVTKNEMMVDVMKDPRNKMVRLKGMDIAPASMATVYWNPVSKEVHLTVNNLPEPPQGMQYQLWAIVDGAPIDAGMIDMDDAGLHKMKSFANAQAFAITLEKEGGSPTPNMAAMYVMGSV